MNKVSFSIHVTIVTDKRNMKEEEEKKRIPIEQKDYRKDQ